MRYQAKYLSALPPLFPPPSVGGNIGLCGPKIRGVLVLLHILGKVHQKTQEKNLYLTAFYHSLWDVGAC